MEIFVKIIFSDTIKNITTLRKLIEKMKKEIIKKIKNTYCRIKCSKIEGVGIFAIRDIPKGKDPFFGCPKQKWQELTFNDYKKLDKEIIKMIDDFFVIEEDKSVYVPENGLNGMDISFFLNNSKNPNLKIVGDGKKTAVSFVSAKKIKKGEELTVSYATFDEKYKK